MIGLLCKLSPGSPSFSSSSRCTGSKITSSDVAASLAYISDPIGVPLILVKYPNFNKHADLHRELRNRVQEWIETYNWRTLKGNEIWDKFVDGAIDEYLNKKCTLCKGKGILYNRQSVQRECERCEGTGFYQPNNSERARVLGIDNKSFTNTWEERWEFTQAELCRIELQSLSEIKEALR